MTQLNTGAVIRAIQSLLPPDRKSHGLHEPEFAGNEWTYVKECIDTGWVSSVGKFVGQFEQKLQDFTGVQHTIAVCNGTAALHICLKLVGVEAGDEVLAPALTFIATANAIAYCSAIPHFVDSEERSLGVDAAKLGAYLREIAEKRPGGGTFNRKTGRRIRALVVMHTFGHPVDLDAISEICREWSLELIEDAAESLGSYYKGKHTGHWGRVSALSFNGNKVVTTGGGGAILTQDPELGRLAKHLTTTAKLPHRWAFNHDQIGYNYRLPNLNAALGCAQLESLPRFVRQKRLLAEAYHRIFGSMPGVRSFVEPDYGRSNYWLNALLLEPRYAMARDELLQGLHDQGILARPVWTLMHRLPMFESCPRMDLSLAESLESRIINLPSSANLGAHLG